MINIRQVTEVDENCIAKVVQINNYYPFGMQYCDGTVDDFDQNHKYNGKEYDKMHGLNTYDYGARQYNPVTARWDRMDPLCEKDYGTSPYVYCGNDPIKHIDPDGNLYGDYYLYDGTRVGSDGYADNKAYVENARGLMCFKSQKFSELPISNTILNEFANTIAEESSGNIKESYALASAIVNLSKYKGKSIEMTLKTEGIYGYRNGGFSSDYKNNLKHGMEAAINALTGGTDYSNGALRWDGFDLAAKGFNHIKALTAGISISPNHYQSFKDVWPNRLIRAFSGGKYDSFSSNFCAGNHPAIKGPNKGLTLYKSSAVWGRTIFWTSIKNNKFHGTY